MAEDSHTITRKEAIKLVDKWVTLRLDLWKIEMVKQIVGKSVDQYNTTVSICVEMEIDGLAVLIAIDGGI